MLFIRVSTEVPVPIPESSGVFLVQVPGIGTQLLTTVLVLAPV